MTTWRTTTTAVRSWCAVACLGVFAQASAVGAATPAIDDIRADLPTLIREAATSPTRFAVDIPHPASIDSAGTWTASGSVANWAYTVRVATAVSMSLHASGVSLPPDAVLSVRGGGVVRRYTSRDVHNGELWSHPLPGDTLYLSIVVARSAQSRVKVRINSVQAGYRSLGGAVPDHPYFRALQRSAATSGCALNYACEATAGNQGPANATVALVIGNVVQCTGTLVADTPLDAAPYILTARHCENGVLGGGNPGVASEIWIYWDAVTPCVAQLGSIYDGTAPTQFGAQTVVEEQDAWLIKLNGPPVASDAYFAGWDATGGSFVGGYSVHHALGYKKQFVSWNGQALLQTLSAASLHVGYDSTFWGVVNATGNVGAGASGGGLFDPTNRLVGSATLAVLPGGAGTAGVCPLTPAPSPAPSTIVADYTALSVVWAGGGDTTSSTSGVTLQSALDPINTGRTVTDGYQFLPVTISVDTTSAFTGSKVTLQWNGPAARTCTATGGLVGDGWSGTLATSGTFVLTERSGGDVRYGVHCDGPNQAGYAEVGVSWTFMPPIVSIAGDSSAFAGGSVAISWFSNALPCTAGGGTNGDGWAGPKNQSGSQAVPVLVIGSLTYTLTCGSGAWVSTEQITVTALAPFAFIYADANNLRIGQPVTLEWGGGGTCTASGGGSGDGWSGAQPGYTNVTESVAGAYLYTVTCTGAGQSGTASINVSFINAVAAASLGGAPATAEIYTDAGATGLVTFNWISNVRPCSLVATGPASIQETLLVQGQFPSGFAYASEGLAGNYVYTLSCGTGTDQSQATATVTWYTNSPTTNFVGDGTNPTGTLYYLMWNANVWPCTGSGGLPGDGWAGAKAKPFAQQTVTSGVLGAVTYTLSCGSGTQIVQDHVTVTYVAPSISLSSSASQVQINTTFAISWNTNSLPCTLSVSPSTGGSQQIMTPSGGWLTAQPAPGTYTYALSCPSGSASAQVTVSGPPAPVVTLTSSTNSASVNSLVTLTWSSTDATSCTASGGTGAELWAGPRPTVGTGDVSSNFVGNVTYQMSCTNGLSQGVATVQVNYTAVSADSPPVSAPTVTMSVDQSTQTVGKAVKISWAGSNASQCDATGGIAGDGWSGPQLLAGSASITETTAGSYVYSIECSGAPPAAIASVTVAFAQGSSGGPGSTGGGGGVVLPPWLLVLLAGCIIRVRRTRFGWLASSRHSNAF